LANSNSHELAVIRPKSLELSLASKNSPGGGGETEQERERKREKEREGERKRNRKGIAREGERERDAELITWRTLSRRAHAAENVKIFKILMLLTLLAEVTP